MPFLLLCYIIAYLDRVNVGVAGLTMNRDLGLSPAQFGWSAGLFFFGYFLAEVPSNLALQAVGARKWIARILITWGLLSAGTAFVVGPVSFGVMRFLLGLGEAGFTPGVFLYFTYWFPARARGRATAAFLLGIPIANIIGAPLSSSLLTLEGAAGLHGWQWLLILEGIPATILGFVCLFTLTDKPEQAKWLSPAERAWLGEVLGGRAAADRGQACLHAEGRVHQLAGPGLRRRQFLRHHRLGRPGLVDAADPERLRLRRRHRRLPRRDPLHLRRGRHDAVGAPVGRGRRAELVRGRRAAARRGRAGRSAATRPSSALVSIIALCGAVVGIMCYQSTFWPIPSSFLTGSAAAGGLALIVSIGNLGGFVGPFLIGAIREATGSFSWALIAVAGFLILGAVLIRVVGISLQRGRLAQGHNRPRVTANLSNGRRT